MHSQKPQTRVVEDMSPSSNLQFVELPEAPAQPVSSLPVNPAIDVFKGVKVSLEVRLGYISTTVGSLLALKESSVLTMEQSIDEPIDLIYNGQVVARGELVAVDEQFGLRITQTAPIAG